MVGVLELRNATDLNAGYLTDQVRSEVKEHLPRAHVITRENLLVLLKNTDIAACEGECEVETGRRIGADLVISGELLRFGTQYKLNMKMHDTRSGELVSGAVAAGPGADELDRDLSRAVARLLEPLQRADRAEEGAVSIAFGLHATFGAGVSSREYVVFSSGLVSNNIDTAVGVGGGAEGGLHFGRHWTVAGFFEFDDFPSIDAQLVTFGGLVRYQVNTDVFLDAGVGWGLIQVGSSGFAARADVDYRLYGPWMLHFQFVGSKQMTGNGIFAGSDSGWLAGAGLALRL